MDLLCLLRNPGITSGLMKGALSVAASAYKALFTGQGPTQVILTNLMSSLGPDICVVQRFSLLKVKLGMSLTKGRYLCLLL